MVGAQTQQHPLLFHSAAAFNLGVGTFFILLPEMAYELMTGAAAPQSPAIAWMFGMVVIVFGLGYAWAGRNFNANRAIVKLATVGKSAAFLVGLVAYLAGHMTLPAVAGASVDLIYALLFAKTLGWFGS